MFSVLAIFSNSGIICFSSVSFGDENQLLSFLIYICVSLALLFLLHELVFPGVPWKVRIIEQRHKNVVKQFMFCLDRGITDNKCARMNLNLLFTERAKEKKYEPETETEKLPIDDK